MALVKIHYIGDLITPLSPHIGVEITAGCWQKMTENIGKPAKAK